MSAELHSRMYALLADRSSMPDGDRWEHEPLRRLAADLTALVAAHVEAEKRAAVVEALEAAADAYESDDEQPHINRMADTVYRPGDCLSSLWLRDRAAALRGTATREETGR